ncbi:MAG: V-type ATP synthase subunit E [bacterium]
MESMLVDILEKIKDEARKEVEIIRYEADFKIEKIKKDNAEAIEQKKNKIFGQAREKAEKFLTKTESEFEQETKNLLLKKKRDAIDAVFSAILEELKSLDEKSYQDLLSRLAEKIPDLKSGAIFVAIKREKETRKFFEKQGIPVKGTVNASGGFKFLSENFEIDETIENLISIIRSETEMEVINNLFSK